MNDAVSTRRIDAWRHHDLDALEGEMLSISYSFCKQLHAERALLDRYTRYSPSMQCNGHGAAMRHHGGEHLPRNAAGK